MNNLRRKATTFSKLLLGDNDKMADFNVTTQPKCRDEALPRLMLYMPRIIVIIRG
jgi:hypothetical protein